MVKKTTTHITIITPSTTLITTLPAMHPIHAPNFRGRDAPWVSVCAMLILQEVLLLLNAIMFIYLLAQSLNLLSFLEY